MCIYNAHFQIQEEGYAICGENSKTEDKQADSGIE